MTHPLPELKRTKEHLLLSTIPLYLNEMDTVALLCYLLDEHHELLKSLFQFHLASKNLDPPENCNP